MTDLTITNPFSPAFTEQLFQAFNAPPGQVVEPEVSAALSYYTL